MPPAPRAEPTELDTRVDAIETKLDEIATKLDQFLQIELPSPELLEDLAIRVAALEQRPVAEFVTIDEDGQPQPVFPPAQKLCEECGAVDGIHFDDCVTGRGKAAMPKEAAERERLLASRASR